MNYKLLINSAVMFGCMILLPTVCLSQTGSVVFENDSVRISAEKVECYKPKDGIYNDYLILSVDNLTQSTINLSFNKEVWYGNLCFSCKSPAEYYVELILKPLETLKANCEGNENRKLKIFHSAHKSGSKQVLSKFEINTVNCN